MFITDDVLGLTWGWTRRTPDGEVFATRNACPDFEDYFSIQYSPTVGSWGWSKAYHDKLWRVFQPELIDGKPLWHTGFRTWAEAAMNCELHEK